MRSDKVMRKYWQMNMHYVRLIYNITVEAGLVPALKMLAPLCWRYYILPFRKRRYQDDNVA